LDLNHLAESRILIFFQIPNLSKSYIKSNLKSNRDFWTNFYSSNRISKCAQISMQIQSRLGFAHYCCASFATSIVDVAFDIMSRVKLAETIEQLYSTASDREKTNRKLYTTSLNYFRPNRSTSLYAQYIHTIIQYKICKAPCCRGFRGAGEQDS